jgi:FkbM family methyltransferase
VKFPAKTIAKRFLQRSLGFRRYLVLHSLFGVATMRLRRGEGQVLRFIKRLAPDANVLDVGSNVGTMTLLFARHCPRGHVYAFEPIPENIAATWTMVTLFDLQNVTVFPFGLGDHDATVTMVMPSENGVRLEGLSHVLDESSAEEGKRYDVELRRLDGMPDFRSVRVDAIKLDVENYERFVIAGAEQIIARDHPLVYAELWTAENRLGCSALLERHGYRIAQDDGQNVLFVPLGK